MNSNFKWHKWDWEEIISICLWTYECIAIYTSRYKYSNENANNQNDLGLKNKISTDNIKGHISYMDFKKNDEGENWLEKMGIMSNEKYKTKLFRPFSLHFFL